MLDGQRVKLSEEGIRHFNAARYEKKWRGTVIGGHPDPLNFVYIKPDGVRYVRSFALRFVEPA